MQLLGLKDLLAKPEDDKDELEINFQSKVTFLVSVLGISGPELVLMTGLCDNSTLAMYRMDTWKL